VIWIYGICDRPDTPAPRRRGLAQAPLDGVREGDLLAVISRHVHPPGDPALDALWVHERVIERIMTDRAVLPMRFGTRLADDDALHEILAGRQQEFLMALDRVRDRVEIGIRAMQPPAAHDVNGAGSATSARDAMSGRAYLEGKLRNGRRVEREAAALHEPLAALAAASIRHAGRQPDELLRVSYLVDRVAVARFRATVERLQRADPGVAILCTGPWPPYSFVAVAPVSPTITA
jgi:hypothetical protein